MQNINNYLIKNIKIAQFLILFIFTLTGFSVTKDYGISYDELEYRQQGFIVLNSIGEKLFPEKAKKITEKRDISYPKIDEYMGVSPNNFKIQHTFYSLLEYIFFEDSKKDEVFYFRHYINFLISLISLFVFYKTLRINFDRTISSLGGIAFILSPRIFADFFYSPNDIWSLFFLICCLYCIFNFLNKKKIKYFYFLPFFLCLAINVRYINIYIYPVFIFFFILNNKINISLINKIVKQIVLLAFFLFIITPELWYDPKGLILNMFGQLKWTYPTEIMFNGQLILSSEIPWYYLIIWILISSPLVYILYSLFGIFLLIFTIQKNKYSKRDILKFQNSIIMFLFLLIPITAVIIFKPDLFNGWRHFYFLNIPIIYFTCFFLSEISKVNLKYFKQFFFITLIVNFFLLANWMYKNHPYQNIFFNKISKKYAYDFELDYWGLSNLEAIRYLLTIENGAFQISNFDDESRADFALQMLGESRKKITFAKTNDLSSKYFISHKNKGFNGDMYSNKGFKVIKTIKVDNIEINRILVRDN